MLVEYKIKDNVVVDGLTEGDFVIRDRYILKEQFEVLVYNVNTRRIESTIIPNGSFWNGSEVEKDLNYMEEQKRFKCEKRLQEDIKKASVAYVAYKNGWCSDYDEVEINEWINYLKLKTLGSKISEAPPRPNVLKYF